MSEAAKSAKTALLEGYGEVVAENADCLNPFILPEPVDPLAAAWSAVWPEDTGIPGLAARLSTELAKRGFKIVPAGEQ